MRKYAQMQYSQRLADFHLLLYISKSPSLDLHEDMSVLLEAVKHKAVVPEGYQLILESLAH